MKNLLFLLFLFTALFSYSQVTFNTGSIQLDSDLNIINTRGSNNFVSFKQELSVSFGVPEKKIDYMRAHLNMVPGEIFLSLEIAKVSRRPLGDILFIYKKDNGKGWGYIAKQAGIKPGSSAFHELKNSTKSNKKIVEGNQKNRKGKKGIKKSKASKA